MFDLLTAGVMLVLAGVVIVVISTLRSGGHSEVKGAGVILIGPIPIAFGTDAKWVSLALILTVVIIVLSFGLRLV